MVDLKAYIDICLSVLYEQAGGDHKEVANATGLCISTLYRLARHDFTLAIHVGTLQTLAEAAGFKMELSKEGVNLSF